MNFAQVLFEHTLNGPDPEAPNAPFVDGRLKLSKLVESNYGFPEATWSPHKKHADINKIEANVRNFDVIGEFGSVFAMPTFSKLGIYGHHIGRREPLILADGPTFILIDPALQAKETSQEILKQKFQEMVSGSRDLPSTTSKHISCVPSNDLTFSSTELANFLRYAGIDVITILSFAMKGPLEWGVSMFRKIRRHDPEARIEFDFAVTVPSEIMHWFSGLSDGRIKKNCIALNKTTGRMTEPHVTLARMFNRSFMDGTEENGILGKCNKVNTMPTNMSAFQEMFKEINQPGFLGTVCAEYNPTVSENLLNLLSRSEDNGLPEADEDDPPEDPVDPDSGDRESTNNDGVPESDVNENPADCKDDSDSDPEWNEDDPVNNGSKQVAEDQDSDQDWSGEHEIDPVFQYIINNAALSRALLHVAIKLKAYGAQFHRWKYLCRADYYGASTVKMLKNRLDAIFRWADDLIADKFSTPGLRLEMTYALSPQFRPGNPLFDSDDISVWDFFDHCFDDLLCFLENVEYVQIPSKHIGQSMKRVANYARSDRVPQRLRAFYGANTTRVSAPMRQFASLIFMDCGLTSDHADQILARDFKDGGRNSWRWLFAEMRRFAIHQNPVVAHSDPYAGCTVVPQTMPPGQTGPETHPCLVDPLVDEESDGRLVSLYKAKEFWYSKEDGVLRAPSTPQQGSRRAAFFEHDLLTDEIPDKDLEEEADRKLYTLGDKDAFRFFMSVKITRLPDPDEKNPYRANTRTGQVAAAAANPYALLSKLSGKVTGKEGAAVQRRLTNTPPPKQRRLRMGGKTQAEGPTGTSHVVELRRAEWSRGPLLFSR